MAPPSELKVEVHFASWDVFKLLYASNLSYDEMLFQLEYEPPLGFAVDLTLRLPNDDCVHIPAKVERVETVGREMHQVRVQFSPRDDEQKAALDATMKHLREQAARKKMAY